MLKVASATSTCAAFARPLPCRCDFIILLQSHPYAVVGQHHPGWVGFLQDYLLDSINCVWFNRGETKDRRIVAERLRSHAHDVRKADTPLLVFPEGEEPRPSLQPLRGAVLQPWGLLRGRFTSTRVTVYPVPRVGTCVNNEYVIQFKKGVFELGVPINPVAIKYNKVFVDAYWNSRQQSFAQHLFGMMTSWAVVCDVWFLDQQVSCRRRRRVSIHSLHRHGRVQYRTAPPHSTTTHALHRYPLPPRSPPADDPPRRVASRVRAARTASDRSAGGTQGERRRRARVCVELATPSSTCAPVLLRMSTVSATCLPRSRLSTGTAT